MKSPVAHWGAREWRKSQDDLVPDSAHPRAFPSTYPMDLMGRIRVKLTAEGGDLVAYGFGGQRVALPHASVGAVHTVTKFRMGRRITHGQALLVLGHQQRVLLRADGLWETHGEVANVCRAAKVARPSHVGLGGSGTARSQRKSGSVSLTPPRFHKAPGYAKLRVHPRGRTPRALVLIAVFGLTMGWGGYLGVLPAVALPGWFGAVRTLIGIIGVVLGVAAGTWAGAAIVHVWVDALRWAGTSLAAGTPAPVRRFFGRRGERSGGWEAAANVGLAALVIALIGWGPGVLIASTAHGLRDSALVADLRANGVTTQGQLIDVPDYSTNSNGEQTVTDVSTLSFKVSGDLVQTTDPSIGGKPLPLNASDPIDTQVPETIVYLPDNPVVAAASQQTAGSVWHGAPTANVISGGLFTLVMSPFAWLLVLRIRRFRWRRTMGFVEDLTT